VTFSTSFFIGKQELPWNMKIFSKQDLCLGFHRTGNIQSVFRLENWVERNWVNFEDLDHFQVMHVEDVDRLPKYSTRRWPPHAVVLRPIRSTGARVTAPGPCAPSSSVRSALSLHAPPLSSGPLSARVRPRCCPHAPPSYGRAGASPTVRVSSLLPPACTPRAPLGAMWVCPTRASRRAPPLVPTSACRSPRASISPRQYVVDLRSLPPNITYRSVVCICLYVKCE
jgi:hypothetical protein